VSDYRGQRLGLPAAGPGSLASVGRRLVAVAVDWFASTFVVALATHGHLTYGTPTFSLAVLGVFGLEVFVLTWLTGASFGQQLVRVQVVELGAGRVPWHRALVRTVLLCLAVPALVWDGDQRGLHDHAANTAVVNIAGEPHA
jgi:uncharacterized RDD family membrane protein YckC